MNLIQQCMRKIGRRIASTTPSESENINRQYTSKIEQPIILRIRQCVPWITDMRQGLLGDCANIGGIMSAAISTAISKDFKGNCLHLIIAMALALSLKFKKMVSRKIILILKRISLFFLSGCMS
jgi:hypothetical protein